MSRLNVFYNKAPDRRSERKQRVIFGPVTPRQVSGPYPTETFSRPAETIPGSPGSVKVLGCEGWGRVAIYWDSDSSMFKHY